MSQKGPSKTLFVGNLHASLEENDLLEIFKPFGVIVECCKRWCHYGFIQFAAEGEAQLAYNSLNGSKLRGRPMRIEFQRKKVNFDVDADSKILTTAATTPTGIVSSSGSYSSFDSMFSRFTSEYDNTVDPFFDHGSNSGSSMDDNNNFEQMTKIFDEIMNDQQVLDERRLASSKKPLSNLDLNCPQQQEIVKQQLKLANQQSSELYLKEKKKSETIKRYSQLVKSSAHQSYLNNTSEFIKNLIHDSILLNPANMKKFENSLSNLSSSPISGKSGISPKKAFNRVLKQCSNLSSVNFFRSINASHTICVEPTDVLEPLNEGEFTEYKLFPTCGGQKKELVVNSVLNEAEGLDFFGADNNYSPSLSLSCSNLSSMSSSMTNSPNITTGCSSSGSGHNLNGNSSGNCFRTVDYYF